MKRKLLHILAPLALSLVAATAAQAACVAEYKAKRDNPLELRYGTMQVSSCSVQGATPEVRTRLQQNGWTLLKVISVSRSGG
ncbi:hypothetical protein [Roseovarius salinarum]|uniref:hypothetical protein n=1 Tax=Roseovarius salinarum TaxID=1981892 RepID=UPI000C33D46D|nr:hypothetical protein [Roseovarius salinarum]